ncbi:MAG: hypothetical protein RSB39_03630 [Oscillospiraceae bacterium]
MEYIQYAKKSFVFQSASFYPAVMGKSRAHLTPQRIAALAESGFDVEVPKVRLGALGRGNAPPFLPR